MDTCFRLIYSAVAIHWRSVLMSFDSNSLDLWLVRETVGTIYSVENNSYYSAAAMFVDDRTDQPLHDRKCHRMCWYGHHQVFLH